jgi:hypothetical protein
MSEQAAPPTGEEEPDFGEASTFPVSLKSGMRKRMPLLNRRFGDGELMNFSPTGKPKLVVGQEAKMKDLHHRIAKIAAKAESDPNYRESLRKRNLEKNGAATLSTF